MPKITNGNVEEAIQIMKNFFVSGKNNNDWVEQMTKQGDLVDIILNIQKVDTLNLLNE